ncbi:Hypothetical predicted protein [Paramuricea clavata]|uniref:Reverse transcriptase/retrotransposon-derived protein RNase H-like domain-containing protein n=1 Tax=Paramuricea clavata TaxID=317549 RepID=A0A7D9LW17_PARCT|nr:Hypothetical predicted protein [Paramuricea clavata]
MVNYLNRFSPILSQISLLLRQMTKKDVPFMWQPEQQQAFQELKEVVTEAPVLSYYNPEKENLIQSDASLKGIGCVLMQDYQASMLCKSVTERNRVMGKKNVIADALSRVICMEPPVDANEVPLIEINEISSTLPANPTKLDEIREKTRQDATLDHLKEVVDHG